MQNPRSIQPTALIVAFLAAPATGVPQVHCGDCEILLEDVATLRPDDTTGPVHETLAASITRDEHGRFYVAPMQDLRSVGVFEPSGAPATRISSLANGPASFAAVMEVRHRNGNLFIVDRGRDKVYTLDPATAAVDSIYLGYGPEGFIPISENEFLAQQPLSGSGFFGMPFHLHTRDDHVRTFGRSLNMIPPNAPARLRRNVASAGSGAFWSSFVDQYRLEQWSLDGQLLSTIVHQREWFVPWDRFNRNLPGGAAPTWFDSIRVDPGTGLIWCTFRVADNYAYPDPEGGETPSSTRLEQNDRYDAFVEVVDSTGAVVAEARFDQALAGYLNDRLNLYEYRETLSRGASQVRVVRLVLAPSRGQN